METFGRNLEQCARTTALDEVVNDVSVHEAEFSKVFEVTSALKLKVDAELSAVSNRNKIYLCQCDQMDPRFGVFR